MPRMDDMLSKPSFIRTFLIGMVPALLVFVVEEMRHPSKPHTEGLFATADIGKHVFSKENMLQFSQVENATIKMNEQLDKVMGGSRNANELACLGGLKTGVFSYLSNMLTRLNLDMTTSISMKNTEDERFMNSALGANAGIVLQAVPTLTSTIHKMSASCSNSTTVSAVGAQMETFMTGQIVPILKAVQTRAIASSVSQQQN